MDDLRTRAQLVASDHAGTVGTVVTRAEVAEAAAESPATLLLDLEARETEATAYASLAVDWDRDTLERVLASTDDDEIALWFDERELAQAFEDADVEGHGFRQRAAVIAVAVTAVGATAAPASARLAAGNEGGGGGTPAAAAAVTAAGAERGLLQDEQIGAIQTHTTGAPGVASNEPALGPLGAPAGAVRGLELQDPQFGATQTLGTSAPGVTPTSGTTLSTGELAAAVAGGALLIAAAGFGATRRRMPPAQPA
jgi:hypothetical protein